MASIKKKGLNYAADCIRDFQALFDLIFTRMNDDVRDDAAIFDAAQRGSSQCDLALTVLAHEPDEIKVYLENGEITMVTGLPPGFNITIHIPGKELTYANISSRTLSQI